MGVSRGQRLLQQWGLVESWEGGKGDDVELVETHRGPKAKNWRDPGVSSSGCPVRAGMETHECTHPRGKPAPFPSSYWDTQLVLKPQIPSWVLP